MEKYENQFEISDCDCPAAVGADGRSAGHHGDQAA